MGHTLQELGPDPNASLSKSILRRLKEGLYGSLATTGGYLSVHIKKNSSPIRLILPMEQLLHGLLM